LGAQAPDGVRIQLVESVEIDTVGVGEGTFPTIRKTLRRIGVDEASLVRECREIRRQADFACRTLPTNRELIEIARSRPFGQPSASALRSFR
jgi:hypothetical protein